MSILLFKEMLLPALVRNINRHRGLTRAYYTDRALYCFSLSLSLSLPRSLFLLLPRSR